MTHRRDRNCILNKDWVCWKGYDTDRIYMHHVTCTEKSMAGFILQDDDCSCRSCGLKVPDLIKMKALFNFKL